ncbi:MAG: hypothetical protein IT374_22960 [Polyangiaceae bacterium]|nr:hypothetical protein [Polyangiaceae bacterium]
MLIKWRHLGGASWSPLRLDGGGRAAEGAALGAVAVDEPDVGAHERQELVSVLR